MKRNGFGTSHKLKTSMPFGLNVPVLAQECYPGDITRLNMETVVKSVIPPVTALTDKIKFYIDVFSVPTRLVDNGFVKNITTSKTGEVKGKFKHWSLDMIEAHYSGSNCIDDTALNGSIKSICPKRFHGCDWTDNVELKYANYGQPVRVYPQDDGSINAYKISVPLPSRTSFKTVTNGGVEEYYAMPSPQWFGQHSLMDYLSADINRNIGRGNTAEFNTHKISAYYMINNFFYTDPEYQKYIAPYFDYEYGRYSDEVETLHRYESLEDEFGNEFEEPSKCGRCFRGLVIHNWGPDYFNKTTKDAQRGTAPLVPVNLSGFTSFFLTSWASGVADGQVSLNVADNILYGKDSADNGFSINVPSSNYFANFAVSDLRVALALQHFQEDCQGVFKWSDFLFKMFGTAPTDLMQDQPRYLGGTSGFLNSSEVLQTVDSDDGYLGDIGGHLSGYARGKTIVHRSKEHETLMAIMYIIPEHNYESGLDRSWTRITYFDMFWKQFVGIGAQGIRADEMCAIASTVSGQQGKNIGFTDRYEELKHEKNRITGRCRVDSGAELIYYYDSHDSSWKSIEASVDGYKSLHDGLYSDSRLLDNGTDYSFHPYAIGEPIYFADPQYPQAYEGLHLFTGDNNYNRLCLPLLRDIFVEDDGFPFLVTIGFNEDKFRQVPVLTKPGVNYV